MQRVKAKRRLSAEAWPAMVSQFVSSGMSAEAFSQQQRVSLASLKHWQQKLQGAKRGQTTVVRAAQPEVAGFVDLGALRGSRTRVELRLDLGDGVLLTLSRG
jgi:putative transposase